MKTTLAVIPVFVMLSVPVQGATLPGDADAGKKLHEANCTTCHTDSVYTRKNRQVTNIDMLKNQLSACGHMMNVTLGKTQVNDLMKYLNDTYYKFK